MRPTLIAKIAMITLLATLAIFALHDRIKPAAEQEVHTVRVLESVRSPYFLPQYLALNLGFFKEQHLDVKITTANPEFIRAALADRRTDVALCGMQKIIFNPDDPEREKNGPIVFATMACRDGSLLLSKKNDSAFQWQKLQNKTIIGSPHNDSSEIALENALRQAGILPYRQVTIYYNIPEKLRVGAFRAGTGNYLQLLEPEASMAEMEGYGQVVASVGAACDDMTITAFAALPGYIESNPEIIQKFTNAIYKAQLWLKQHSAEEAAMAVYPSFSNLEMQVLIKSIERYGTLKIWTDNPVVEREPYERFNTAAKNAGEIAAPVPYDTTVVTSFARQAVETVTYAPETETEKKKRKSFMIFFQ
ncbi:ABC transporter substrate-binding protein [Pelotomaculum terephthalicicum JT]|uniref:ABC transporter substrate-binding protein n=1 Tax=Pelotomaculum TaxID=191373 RepID=UPI0009D0F7DD|nr:MULTISPECIES: ABC transporter substrate-binding protein [Pelotomaculum]MCG9966987.1 ABC transporter substrate-binding protein [Pelotomaculum terephthalicicum JT]OPX91056.1 MAG: NMT1/THI5 like protein [Pelotomaculum sp. PtaB.Bin117]OPY62640.1 MAG: NMT1/THI5 like protein [Pelotomaculum sp. PtaU1.Bin065]